MLAGFVGLGGEVGQGRRSVLLGDLDASQGSARAAGFCGHDAGYRWMVGLFSTNAALTCEVEIIVITI
jgi:hypothetical protein